MPIQPKKELEYVVLSSDVGGDEHGVGDVDRVRRSALLTLKATVEYINARPYVSAWLNTGDLDDLYEAAAATTDEQGNFHADDFLEGNNAFYQAVNAVYKQCKLAPEQKLVVLGNHDIPIAFLHLVDACTLVGADSVVLARAYAKGGKVITPVKETGTINQLPIIGAMNTFEAPKGIPEDKQFRQQFFPHLTFPIPKAGKTFYDQYPDIYQHVLKGKYYLMSHKGLLDPQDAARKTEDIIHKIAANSLASFEGHWHGLTANRVGKTVRFRSGTNHVLLIGLHKETGKPEEYYSMKIL